MRLSDRYLAAAGGCASLAAIGAVGQRHARDASWLKGQLHSHTTNSDGGGTVDEVLNRYADLGFDFVSITDHNKQTPARSSRLLVVPGIEVGVNTSKGCVEPATGEVCAIHANGLFVARALEQGTPAASIARADLYAVARDRIRAAGGLVQINHPAWYWGATADLLGQLAEGGARLFELANGTIARRYETGEGSHPALESMWDQALSAGYRLWATAADDLHDMTKAGRRFVMVRAKRNLSSIRAALERGDFYASTGLILDDVTARGGVLTARAREGAHFTFITNDGRVVQESDGQIGRCRIPDGAASYLRLRAEAPSGMAWTQPITHGAGPYDPLGHWLWSAMLYGGGAGAVGSLGAWRFYRARRL